MKFYAMESHHGNSTSHGFVNDTTVYVFASKSDRDEWVRRRNNVSTRAIKRSEVTMCATNAYNNGTNAPKAFTNDYWCIEPSNIAPDEGEISPIGVIGTARHSSQVRPERFY